MAKAQPDGYQFVLGNVGTHAQNQTLYKNPAYHAATDFAPVSLISTIPNVLVVQASSPAASLADFVKLAGTARPGLNYGSAGNGTSSHLAAAQFAKAANVTLQHIPFKGGAPANQELLAGRTPDRVIMAGGGRLVNIVVR